MRQKKLMVLITSMVMMLLAGFTLYANNSHTLTQTERMAALCKVWGLVKYYHPNMETGEIDWDQELFNVLPAVKDAGDFDTFNSALDSLIIAAGDVDIHDYNPGTPANPDNEQLFKWVKDKKVFSPTVSKKLHTLLYKHTPTPNYYVYPHPYADYYPQFTREKRYDFPLYPEENHRVLGLFRYWNALNYFYAYKELIDGDWEELLEEFIPRVLNAANAEEYHLAIRELAVKTKDSHNTVRSNPLWMKFGYKFAPCQLVYIDDKYVISRVFDQYLEFPGQLQRGDIILKCHNTTVEEFRESMRKYVVASNDAAFHHSFAKMFVQTTTQDRIDFTISRGGQVMDINIPTIYYGTHSLAIYAAEAELGDWKILPGNIGYIHGRNFKTADVDTVMPQLMGTKAIIFDIRNYPGFHYEEICKYLAPEPVPFYAFREPSFDYPGMYEPTGYEACTYEPNPDYYKGKIIVLVDENSISYSEFYTMALQSMPDTTVIGGNTRGTDGDATGIYLPGYIYTNFTSVFISYPDGSPSQQVGITPDIYVRPSIEGLIEGRDEVLEKAIEFAENN